MGEKTFAYEGFEPHTLVDEASPHPLSLKLLFLFIYVLCLFFYIFFIHKFIFSIIYLF